MDKEETLFDDLDEEMVSPNDEISEEQPNEIVPPNSKKKKFIGGLTSGKNVNQNNYEKNNKSTINKLNDIKNKKQGLNNPAAEAGKQLGNKIAGKSEEEKSELEKATDNVGGKVSGAAITAATGGIVSGPAAEALGNAAYQVAKKQIEKKIKMYLIIGGVFALIILLFILMLVSNEDDEQDSSSQELESFVTGQMSEEDLKDYLVYIDVCTKADNLEELAENLAEEFDETMETLEEGLSGVENIINTADCKYARQYFKKIKSIKEKFSKECTKEITEKKDIMNPCGVSLNTLLLHETLSFGKSNDELWNKRETPHQEKDIEELSRAMTEYVRESCYVLEKKYYDKDGKEHDGPCEQCTEKETKINQDWYYFQISHDKYIAFLKYGYDNDHPYYSSGRMTHRIGKYSTYNLWKSSDDNYVKIGENHDHECMGPNNSFNASYYNINDSDNSIVYSGNGQDIANYALQYVGKVDYVWGGNSLENGVDCSGFVQQVYKNFGINLPRTSTEQGNFGKSVSTSEMKPGDIISYASKNGIGHVGIYIGNGEVVQAGSTKTGITTKAYDYRTVNSIRRVVE